MVKKFCFSMERLLRIRRLEENLEKADFVRSQIHLFEAEEAKKQSVLSKNQCLEHLAFLRQQNPLPVYECLQSEASTEDFTKTIRHQEKTIARREIQVEAAKQKFLAASTRRKTMERFKEIQFLKYRKEISKQEAKFFDEISAQRDHRRKYDN